MLGPIRHGVLPPGTSYPKLDGFPTHATPQRLMIPAGVHRVLVRFVRSVERDDLELFVRPIAAGLRAPPSAAAALAALLLSFNGFRRPPFTLLLLGRIRSQKTASQGHQMKE